MTRRRSEKASQSPSDRLPRAVLASTLGALAIALSACHATPPAPTDGGQPATDAARPTDGVHLSASQLTQIHIDTLSATGAPDSLTATGTVEFNADRVAKLLPPVSGQVQQLSINVGDQVHKNDVLFVLSSREVAAAVADYEASRKDRELAEKTAAMTRDLFEHAAASRMALDQADSDLAKASSRVMEAQETLQVLGLDPDAVDGATHVPPRIPVRSPIDGTVIERVVTDGQFVGPDTQPLITIADLSRVWVEGDIFERDLRHVSAEQMADVTTAAYPSDRFSARVSRIASVVDPQTRTAKVRLLVSNPQERLKPGMFASITLYLPDTAASLTMPAKAVFVENGQSFAYVQRGAETFVRRRIETETGGSGRVHVLDGVRAGDRVVSDGVLLLRQLETDAAQ
jgi:cobalt-zinc-cadmium efflux system membrane fusion protein